MLFKKTILLLLCFLAFADVFSQGKTYWQQQVNNQINVLLDDQEHMLYADITMEYFNNSPDTLSFIWIHLWPNAYKNDKTAFSEQLLMNGRTDFYFADEKDRGYINQLKFTVNEKTADVEDHPEHQDIVKLILPEPLLPGSNITIRTPFHVKLPKYFSRSGHIDHSYQITQWFPKPAVYDVKGWHPIPYLEQGEFYSEFGNYTVTISAPQDYIIAATGKQISVNSNNGIKTSVYRQDKVHDFAWFADKDFEVLHDTIQLSDHVVDAYAYYNKKNAAIWKNSMKFIKRAVTTKSDWIGNYPYDIVSVVEKPGDDNGGMEYPTITFLSPGTSDKDLDFVINHEVGHNWFYGILASNERQFPWMDEGMNSYYDNKYENLFYGDSLNNKKGFFGKRIPEDYETVALQHLFNTQQDQPINTTSEKFNFLNYGLVSYIKTAQWLQSIEDKIGKASFDSLMRQYYSVWKFRHPQPEDFKDIFQQSPILSDSTFFEAIYHKGAIVKEPRKKLKAAFIFNIKETDTYHYISFFPVAGYNKYDQLMPGMGVHNYTLPAQPFKFLMMPMYSTGARQLNGMGRISYTFYPSNNGSRLETSLAASKFSLSQFTDSTGKKNYLSFTKIVPAIRYTFPKSPLSSRNIFIQFKSFQIKETQLRFTRDTVAQVFVISYPKQSRSVQQLELNIADQRKLYPYHFQLLAEQGKDFVRASVTGNYFFNYPKGGGLNVRFFAGKFIYTSDKTFLKEIETDRYHLNLSGVRGNEDYTYSDYFIGRNEFEGFASQQMRIRDGAFKVATDLLINKVGKTDDWLSSLNFTTDVPDRINPLSVLPIKIPFKIFADVGTYAEAWNKNAETGRFLYDAGIQLQLFKLIDIYWPILYSKVYRNYYASTITEKKFSRTLSFSINLRNINFQKIFSQIQY